MLDAAFLTRRAAEGARDIGLNGVIVFPEVYDDKEGVSLGRAYSLFRELERFQAVGLDSTDRYSDGMTDFMHMVPYDAHNSLTAKVKFRLFDNLFYIGSECTNDDKRLEFFSSVANAVDPYLDDNSGQALQQAAVNTTGAASAFGAARLFIPFETLAAIFAWEEVERYIEASGAPRIEDEKIGLHSGASADRQIEGKGKFTGILFLFEALLRQVDKGTQEKKAFVHNSLQPREIVKQWYQFETEVMPKLDLRPPDLLTAKLTYINPFVSLAEENVEEVLKDADRIRLKTYEEMKKAKTGEKESNEKSRDRFRDKISDYADMYLKDSPGEGTFEKGRQFIKAKMTQYLEQRVDDLVEGVIKNTKTNFTWDPNNQYKGTLLNRLYDEIEWMISDGGPIKDLKNLLSEFSGTLKAEEMRMKDSKAASLNELENCKKPGFLHMGGWVEPHQKRARNELYEYVLWYQKTYLLEDMHKLVEVVETRLKKWRDTMKDCLYGLVLDKEHSSFYRVRRRLDSLKNRLGDMTQVSTAMICYQEQDGKACDIGMNGYRKHLRDISVVDPGGNPLMTAKIAESRWECRYERSTPELHLVIGEGENALDLAPSKVKSVHEELFGYFQDQIKRNLTGVDIFDYLLFEREQNNVGPSEIAQSLVNRAKTLIDAGTVPETCMLVYRTQDAEDKSSYARDLQAGVSAASSNAMSPVDNYSDPWSVTLLKIKKPEIFQINDLTEAKNDYLHWQNVHAETGVEAENDLAQRSIVYHAFRGEFEAMYIERAEGRIARSTVEERHHVAPRIARLLDAPEQMRAFVRCVATGAIYRKEREGWFWKDTRKNDELRITTDPTDDIVRAAVVFVLQKREAVRGSTKKIDTARAFNSAADMAQQQGKSEADMLEHFRDNDLDAYLGKHHDPKTANVESAEKERESLKKVFQFYCDPDVRTDFSNRSRL
jgi:hypothetical protein